MAKNETYEEFVDKFKPKRTTDDCYTPKQTYETIKNWAIKKLNINESKIIRPFYPGGDYENYDYKKDDVVLDNPPFSILSKIIKFYEEKNINYFLFAPSLTVFSTLANKKNTCVIVTDTQICYENGAKVPTCFITNMANDIKIMISPDLMQDIDKANNLTKPHKKLPKYAYPDNLVTMNRLNKLCSGGQQYELKENIHFIRQLDSQKEYKKAIYGTGFLISDKAAKELQVKELAAKKPIFRFELSDREKEIINSLQS